MKKEILELRSKMKENGMDVYYIPSGDDHNSEYVNDYFKAREFMSNLSGESGELIVNDEGAYLWTDGRYFLQAEAQLKDTDITLMKMAEPGVPTVEEFLIDLAQKKEGYVLGFDGRVISSAQGEALNSKLSPLGVTIKLDKDLVDEIWTNRPKLVPSKLFQLPMETVGISAKDKIESVRKEMSEKNADYLLVTDLMETAWLLNMRGNDVLFTPVFFSFILLSQKDITVYLMDGALENGNLPKELSFVKVKSYDDIGKDLSKLKNGSTLWFDNNTTNYALRLKMADKINLVEGNTPIAMMKALKNDAEIKSTKEAHIKDGVAMVKFLKWIKGNVGKEKLTELDASNHLYNLRAEEGSFESSFATIAGYGPNGAIIHYEPTEETNLEIKPESFLLLDSGGQYMDGTTDITRTIAMGPLTKEMIDGYTYVLKSHIAMNLAILSPDATGMELDAIVRAPMRAVGLDFKHGLSHGVGHILSCHEGPNILRRVPTYCPIKPRMIMSDEPGLYIDHEYGIRIENELLLKEDKNGNTIFESITFCPYEPKAINVDLLNDKEIEWLNNYHKKVEEVLLPRLDEEHQAFLKEQTKEIYK